MRIFTYSIGFLLLVTSIGLASECPVGYVPPVSVLAVSTADLERMSLSDEDRVLAGSRGESLRAREIELQAAYHDASTELALLLSSAWPDRSKADDLVVKMQQIVADLSQLRSEYVFEMTDLLRAENLRKMRTRVLRRSKLCDQSIAVPRMRVELSAGEKKILELTEDESKYLADFDRRETYFRAEQRNLDGRLDNALRARDIDRTLVRSLLDSLAASVKQQMTNRMDRFFYAEHVLLSPERVMKVKAFRAKHMKRVKVKQPVRK